MRVNYLCALVAALFIMVGCGDGETPSPKQNPDTGTNTPEQPEDDTIVAGYFGGEYYGDYYSPGVGNYFIHLSDNGFDDDGYALPNTVYYTFDLYSTYYDGAEVERLPLPEGTYTLDLTDSFAEGTFSVAYSKYYTTDDAGEVVKEHKFEAGVLVVTATEATLEATIGGEQHRVVFRGVADVADKRSATGEDVGGGDVTLPEDAMSTLEEDYALTLDHHTLLFEVYGDYYGSGLQNYTFAIWPDDYVGDHVQFDVVASTSADDHFYGTFKIGDESTPYSFFPGEILIEGEAGYMVGSWYYTDDGVTMAPFVGGELRVSSAEDDKMSVSFAVLDDKGNTITGSWSGKATELE